MSQVTHTVSDDQPLPTPGDDGDARPARRQPSMDDSAWGMHGYVLSGILFWGGMGWLADNWLERGPLFLPIGVLLGAALGVYLGYMKFLR